MTGYELLYPHSLIGTTAYKAWRRNRLSINGFGIPRVRHNGLCIETTDRDAILFRARFGEPEYEGQDTRLCPMATGIA